MLYRRRARSRFKRPAASCATTSLSVVAGYHSIRKEGMKTEQKWITSCSLVLANMLMYSQNYTDVQYNMLILCRTICLIFPLTFDSGKKISIHEEDKLSYNVNFFKWVCENLSPT